MSSPGMLPTWLLATALGSPGNPNQTVSPYTQSPKLAPRNLLEQLHIKQATAAAVAAQSSMHMTPNGQDSSQLQVKSFMPAGGSVVSQGSGTNGNAQPEHLNAMIGSLCQATGMTPVMLYEALSASISKNQAGMNSGSSLLDNSPGSTLRQNGSTGSIDIGLGSNPSCLEYKTCTPVAGCTGVDSQMLGTPQSTQSLPGLFSSSGESYPQNTGSQGVVQEKARDGLPWGTANTGREGTTNHHSPSTSGGLWRQQPSLHQQLEAKVANHAEAGNAMESRSHVTQELNSFWSPMQTPPYSKLEGSEGGISFIDKCATYSSPLARIASTDRAGSFSPQYTAPERLNALNTVERASSLGPMDRTGAHGLLDRSDSLGLAGAGRAHPFTLADILAEIGGEPMSTFGSPSKMHGAATVAGVARGSEAHDARSLLGRMRDAQETGGGSIYDTAKERCDDLASSTSLPENKDEMKESKGDGAQSAATPPSMAWSNTPSSSPLLLGAFLRSPNGFPTFSLDESPVLTSSEGFQEIKSHSLGSSALDSSIGPSNLGSSNAWNSKVGSPLKHTPLEGSPGQRLHLQDSQRMSSLAGMPIDMLDREDHKRKQEEILNEQTIKRLRSFDSHLSPLLGASHSASPSLSAPRLSPIVSPTPWSLGPSPALTRSPAHTASAWVPTHSASSNPPLGPSLSPLVTYSSHTTPLIAPQPAPDSSQMSTSKISNKDVRQDSRPEIEAILRRAHSQGSPGLHKTGHSGELRRKKTPEEILKEAFQASLAAKSAKNPTALLGVKRGPCTEPQALAARARRERINARMRVLQGLVPGGNQMTTENFLLEAVQYSLIEGGNDVTEELPPDGKGSETAASSAESSTAAPAKARKKISWCQDGELGRRGLHITPVMKVLPIAFEGGPLDIILAKQAEGQDGDDNEEQEQTGRAETSGKEM
eukprot:jgi/Mesen1/6835/ME000351S05951